MTAPEPRGNDDHPFDHDDGHYPRIYFRPEKQGKPFIVHWAGGVVIRNRDHVTRMGAGFPACCWGDRARKIAAEGRQSWDRANVTCKLCLKQIERHDFSARMDPEEKQWQEMK